MEQRKLLTIPEAAERVGITRAVMWRHVQNGRIPSIKAGRQRLVYDDDVERFRIERRRPGRPPKTGNDAGRRLCAAESRASYDA